MDNKIAAVLLESLLERIERDQSIGTVSSLEYKALQQAFRALGEGDSGAFLAPVVAPTPPAVAEAAKKPIEAKLEPIAPPVVIAPTLPKVELVLTAIERDTPTNPDVMLCLDFGTAMSKAFASVQPDEHLDLELGAAAGRAGYTIPSSVFISDIGKAYFGFEAIEMSQDLIDSGRERLDSIKGWISLRSEGNLDG